MSRGYRNNNPCNIRCSRDKFDGEVIPSKDKEFKQFTTMAYGFRAVFKLLHNYSIKYGCRNMRQMIDRFAPPIENDTSSYLSHVAKKSLIDPDSPINTKSIDIMVSMVSAMAQIENGTVPNQKDVLEGWQLFINQK